MKPGDRVTVHFNTFVKSLLSNKDLHGWACTVWFMYKPKFSVNFMPRLCLKTVIWVY